jgi:pyruvate dehydrogenase kinase 2/3/4
MFVPEHLRFVVGELLRNASRVTLQKYAHATQRDEATLSAADETELPAVRVVISVSGHQVVIKVSDEAGGIARSQLADVWMYNSWRLRGGAGMGLPLARLYAMYFGGSLQLFPMEGYGTDAYATFNRLGDANSEHCLNAPIVAGDEDGFAPSEVRDSAPPPTRPEPGHRAVP